MAYRQELSGMEVLWVQTRRERRKKVTHKVCGVQVVHGGGTTNLKTHLRTWYRSTHDELFPDKQGTMVLVMSQNYHIILRELRN